MVAFDIRRLELPTARYLRDGFVLNSKTCGVSATVQLAA